MNITDFVGKIKDYFSQEIENLGNGLEVSTDGGKTYLAVEEASYQLRSTFQISQGQSNSNTNDPVVYPQSSEVASSQAPVLPAVQDIPVVTGRVSFPRT